MAADSNAARRQRSERPAPPAEVSRPAGRRAASRDPASLDSLDPRAPPARHRERAGRDGAAHVQRDQGPAEDDGRQLERARAQARGRRLRHVHEVIRGPAATDGVSAHRPGAAGARALSDAHGGAHPRDPGHAGPLTAGIIFLRRHFDMQSTFPSVSQRDSRRHHHGRQRALGGGPRATAAAGHRAGAEAVRRVVEAAPDSASAP